VDAEAMTATQVQPSVVRRAIGDPRLRSGMVFLGSAAVVAAVRAWQMVGLGAVWWNDFADFLASARTGQRELPLVTDVLIPHRWVVLGVVAVAALVATRRGRWRSPLVFVGAATVVLAAPHALVSWHSDGMETARHLMVPALQLYLGTLLTVLGLVGGRAGSDIASMT
jgi:hypothetical protein